MAKQLGIRDIVPDVKLTCGSRFFLTSVRPRNKYDENGAKVEGAIAGHVYDVCCVDKGLASLSAFIEDGDKPTLELPEGTGFIECRIEGLTLQPYYSRNQREWLISAKATGITPISGTK